MVISRTKKRNKRKLTIKQKLAMNYVVEHGGTMGAALDHAGYSPAVVKTPSKVFNSPAFAQELERAGVTDDRVGKKYSRLLDATVLDKDTFPAEAIITKKGRKRLVEWKHLSNEKLKELIEGKEDDPTGCKVMYIKTYEKHKEVYFRKPDNVVQMGMIDKIGKSKGHFAPDQMEVRNYNLTAEEEQLLKQMKVI